MKKTVRNKKLGSLLKSIHRKNSNGFLAIEARCEHFLNHGGVAIRSPKTVSRRVANEMVVKDAIGRILKTIELSRKDISNIRGCSSFVNRRFPHAFLSLGSFGIGVHNLTAEETACCVLQKGLRFVYYKF